ncbi:hypothetical protein AABB24_012436, partial [Solanum stoloniferum]
YFFRDHVLLSHHASSSSPKNDAPSSSPMAPMASPTCSPIPFVRERLLAAENVPSITQPSQIDLKRSIFERIFFSFIIDFLFALGLGFPRIQNLNSWSPN